MSRLPLTIAAAAGIATALWVVRRRLRDRERAPSPSVPPRLVILFSGKRKSGKDYVTDRLQAMLGDRSSIGRLSGPLKGAYAKEHGLDFTQLLSDGPYKEKYRADMISWGEKRRRDDPGFFAKLVLAESRSPVLIISDARRMTDMAFFTAQYPSLTVRVGASDATRSKRGWIFTKGVDDAESECGLDTYKHDLELHNDGDAAALEAALRALEAKVLASI